MTKPAAVTAMTRTALRVSLLAVDTHGVANVAMGIARLLGFDLYPRQGEPCVPSGLRLAWDSDLSFRSKVRTLPSTTFMDDQEPVRRAPTHRSAQRGTGQPVDRWDFVDTSPSVFDSSARVATIRVRRWVGGTGLAVLALGCSVAVWLAGSYFIRH